MPKRSLEDAVLEPVAPALDLLAILGVARAAGPAEPVAGARQLVERLVLERRDDVGGRLLGLAGRGDAGLEFTRSKIATRFSVPLVTAAPSRASIPDRTAPKFLPTSFMAASKPSAFAISSD